MKDEIYCWAARNGWKKDRYGNMKKEKNEELYRLKFGKKTLRYEVQVIHEASQYSSEKKEWVRLYSGYYSKLSIQYNKLCGMKR